ncbi:MAG: hypothetical protein ABR519_05580 [Bacteroidales bacterium]
MFQLYQWVNNDVCWEDGYNNNPSEEELSLGVSRNRSIITTRQRKNCHWE